MTEKPQFDQFLGGDQSLPPEANILKLASARANEIAAMTYSLENPQQTKLVFQKLPIHMRRRVMSHNAKRMPRRLREIHIRQMSKSGLPPKSKRPSRKWRRRPQNLLIEYKRRQDKIIWLETHIWHAKRFKIVDKWGYKIPFRSNNRCFRSSYRALAKHSLIQDISYYTCVEIEGERIAVIDKLKLHCDPNGLTFAAKSLAQGNREGNLMFYEKNQYPRKPIGVVDFVWMPTDSDIRKIWIWVHPSFCKEFLKQISQTFEFVMQESRREFVSRDKNFRINLLRDSLNRFRLCGPLSVKILTDALRLPTKIEENFKDRIHRGAEKCKLDPDNDLEILNSSQTVFKDRKTEPMEIDEVENEPIDSKFSWDVDYYQDSTNTQSFRVQKEVFQLLRDLKSPGQLPPSVVMAFTVLDPRYFVPQKRAKSEISVSSFETIPVPPTLANVSPIWDKQIRQLTVKNFRNTNEINKIRSNNLVPGVYNDQEFDENSLHKIPILIIQKPGSKCKEKSIGFSSAIDIILPSGWANAFWTSLILRNAKPGGLRESRSMIFENLTLNSGDFNPPDTESYSLEALETKYELVEKYFRYPPNRRPNYIKLGISSPFYCEWKLLMTEWTDSENFYVLRDRKALNYLQESITNSLSDFNRKDSKLFKDVNVLITVKISIEEKGCPKDFAIIALPTIEDLDKFKNKKKWGGPTAKIFADTNESARKILRRGHLALLKRLRRQRVRQRENNCNKDKKQIIADLEMMRKTLKRKAKSAVDIQAEKMKNLYLPKCKTVRYSCDREVMGYVVKGDFSFTESKGIGIGYVALNSIFLLIERKSDIVLIRNTKSRQYRIARLSILI